MLFFFQAEDGIRDLVRSRGLGDVYKRQAIAAITALLANPAGDAAAFDHAVHEAREAAAAVALALIHI
mgnify:CR=1 FL=1